MPCEAAKPVITVDKASTTELTSGTTTPSGIPFIIDQVITEAAPAVIALLITAPSGFAKIPTKEIQFIFFYPSETLWADELKVHRVFPALVVPTPPSALSLEGVDHHAP